MQRLARIPEPEPIQIEAFRGERLELVRSYKGLTQTLFARLLGISTAAVSDLENGKRSPSAELVARLSYETGFLSEFFFSKLQDPFLEHECSFRHRRSTTQRQKDQVRAHAALLGVVTSELRSFFKFPNIRVPQVKLKNLDAIEDAARYCRLDWGLDANAPIKHVVRVLESAGVFVISGSVDVAKIDAFSRNGRNPMVFLNRSLGTSPSRWNFDLAHELGHLVLHTDLRTGSGDTEAQADQFASAFLMPASSFASDFRSREFSWSLVFELKRRWQTSAAAIIRRGRDLDLISEMTYRRAFQYMSAKGWRSKGEPYEPLFQEAELFNGALSSLKAASGGDLINFARSIGMSVSVFGQITGFGAYDKKNGSIVTMKRPQ